MAYIAKPGTVPEHFEQHLRALRPIFMLQS